MHLRHKNGVAGHPKRLKETARVADISSMASNHRSVLRSASLSLMAMLVVFGAAFAGAQSGFGDVPEDAYYADAVQWLVDEGLATGGVDGAFRPEDPVTRGETAVFLWRLAGQPDAPVHRFTDVTVGWQDDAVSWMSATGITQGATPTAFDPNGIVTRGALSVFLHRLAGEPPAPPHSFTDVSGPGLQAPVSWIAATGISAGIAPGEFGPDVPVIRGQMAVFLQRFGESGILEVASEPEALVPAEPEFEDTQPSTATLTVSPASPRVAERMEVRGSGFTTGSVLVTVGDEVAGVAEANASGSFALSIPVPDVEPGVRTVAAVSDGEVTASAQIDVRPTAPSSNLLAVLVLLAGAGGAGWWWWRQRRNPGPAATADTDEASPEPETAAPARVEPRTSDVFSVMPVAAGMLDNLAQLDGTLWATAQIDFDGVGHAMVLTTAAHGQEWDVIADLGPGHIDAVTVSERDAVAIGSRFVFDELGVSRRATMWHSNDLRSWIAIGLPGESFEEASFDGILGVGDTLVAYGRNASGPCLWSGSDNGWSARRMMGPVDLVVATGHGALSFGRNSEARQGIVLASADGQNWDLNSHPSTALFGSSTVLSVVDFQGGLVAAGYDNLRGSAAVWVSDNGVQWHRSPMEFPDETGIEHLVVADGVLVAIGSIRASGSGARRPRVGVWTSIDAVEWSVADDDGLAVDGRVNSIQYQSPSVYIAGSRVLEAEGTPVPVVWRYFGAGLQTSAS